MVLMDVCRAEQIETTRPPLVHSEKNIGVARGHKSNRQVPSRYKAAIASGSPFPVVGPKRCPSPNVTRVVPAAVPSYTKRAQSAERRRPSTPSSSPRPTTPVQDASTPMQNLARRLPGGRTSEGLWPSGTMRSLCVSFQSDTFSIPITKKEKPVNQVSQDYTLKPSANAAHRQTETPHVQRKATPERKRTPLRGRNSSDQVENSKPVDSLHGRVIDQHRLLSRTGGMTGTSALTKSVNLTDKASKAFSSPLTGRGVSPLRRSPVSDVMGRGLQKAQTEVATQSSFIENGLSGVCTNDALRSYGLHEISQSSPSSERTPSTTRTCRSQPLPIPGSRLPSPIKNRLLSSSTARGTPSPSRTRSSAPFPSASSTTSQSSSLSSVLSFIADYKKGKRSANYLEDAHQLRILHNRYLQWRFANARSDVALLNQRIIAEDTLCNVWNTTSELLDSVITKRINLQQLRQELKLDLVLTEQMVYLENWALLEKEHSSSFSEAITSLEACTLRLPITTGATVNIHSLKSAICSAADVMQAMGSSVCSLLSRVEETNCLVSKLADVISQEKAMVHECGDILASTSAMQGEENSLRTHAIQLKQASTMREQPIPILLTPV